MLASLQVDLGVGVRDGLRSGSVDHGDKRGCEDGQTQAVRALRERHENATIRGSLALAIAKLLPLVRGPAIAEAMYELLRIDEILASGIFSAGCGTLAGDLVSSATRMRDRGIPWNQR